MKRILLSLLGAVLALTVGLVPAVAKTPPGPSRLTTEPAVVDAHLGYQKQKTCSPAAKPGTTALLSLLIKTWGGSSWGISRSCNVGGTSEHKEGRALDWHKDVRKAKDRKAVADAMKWLTANNGEVAYRLGIMYIIWDQKIWSIYYQELGWRKMAGRGSRTANHKDHVHISLSWDGAMKQTSWWTGQPVTSPLNRACGVNTAPPCLPTVRRASSAWQTSKVKVPPFLPAPWTIPGIGGSPQVGRILTGVAGTWVPAGSTVSYQWLADGKAIPGATGEQLTVPASLIGKAIRLRVTALTPGGARITKTSDGTNDVVKGTFRTTAPVIVGDRTTGTLLTVQLGTWRPTPTKWTYQWYRGKKKISWATGPTYRLRPSDLGKNMSVKVTAKASGFTSVTLTAKTAKVRKGKLPVVAVPTVNGSMVVGQTLGLSRGTWAPTPIRFTYQWFRGGDAIPKATGSKYRLTAADAGKVVRVRVRGSRTGYLNTYSWSAIGDPVAGTATTTAPTVTEPPTSDKSGTEPPDSPITTPQPPQTPKPPTPTPSPTPTTPSPSPTPSPTLTPAVAASGGGSPGER